MGADVTKELLIKIGTEGGEKLNETFGEMDFSLDRFMIRLTGINSAWDMFSKAMGIAKTAMREVWEQVDSFVDVGAKFEQLGIRFETIFGGQGPAQAALDWAVEFAAKTPMTLDDVTNKMLKLKSYGFDPMNGMLETIGNAAFAVGADFDGIVVALGQMGLKGKVVQQELNQLSERNVPAIRWLQEELGLTATQMGDIGNQAIKSDLAIKTILARMDKEYAGGMMKAGDSWLGAMSTILDTWTIFQKKVMDTGPMDFLVKNIRLVRDGFAEWSEFTGPNLAFRSGGMIATFLGEAKGSLIDSIIPGMKQIANLAYDILKQVTPLWNLILDISGLITGTLMLGIQDMFKTTKEMDTLLLGRDQAIHKIFGLVADGIIGIMSSGAKLKAWVLGTIGEIQSAIGGIFLDLSTSSRGAEFLSRFGLDGIIPTLGQRMFRGGTKMTAEANIGLENTLEGLGKSRKIFKAFDFLRMNPADPLGIDKLKPGEGEKNARLLWERGVNERTSGVDLYEDEKARGIKDGAAAAAGAMLVQLGAPPGDALLAIIVDYLNQAIRAEGTVGAGF